MKFIFSLFFTLVFAVSYGVSSPTNNQLVSGDWFFKLKLSNTCYIPIYGSINNNVLTLNNGDEKIDLEPFSNKEGNLVANFTLYHSSVFITESSKNNLVGYWKNYNKKGDYKIEFIAVRKSPRLKKNRKILKRLNGKWETTIEYGKSTKLVGEFNHVNNELHGTFRSETGDYRYLAGHAIKDSLFLSCFDGTHCYLFTGRIFDNDSISGHFYSGNHYKTTWTAKKTQMLYLETLIV